MHLFCFIVASGCFTFNHMRITHSNLLYIFYFLSSDYLETILSEVMLPKCWVIKVWTLFLNVLDYILSLVRYGRVESKPWASIIPYSILCLIAESSSLGVYVAVFNIGGGNPGGMMPIQQQQQHGSQGAFGGMASNTQNLQSGMVTLQNTQQNHPNFSQQRQQNPQW